jgi:hypothetical protein
MTPVEFVLYPKGLSFFSHIEDFWQLGYDMDNSSLGQRLSSFTVL